MKYNEELFGGVTPFRFSAKYIELYAHSVEHGLNSHIHEECEIYINLSGDVSFMVENNIYPVKPGDIIITRPFEYHHCVYHSDKLHKHFWILFSPLGNEYLLNLFYKREAGSANHISLPPEGTEKLIALCHQLAEPESVPAERYYQFFKLIHMLQNTGIVTDEQTNHPSDVTYAINHINRNFAQTITISEIAKQANVSINTLERHFKNVLNISPHEYLKKKRLSNAAMLLAKGCSVTESSCQSGFSNYSDFISLFKRTYGMTPLAYKKEREKRGILAQE